MPLSDNHNDSSIRKLKLPARGKGGQRDEKNNVVMYVFFSTRRL